MRGLFSKAICNKKMSNIYIFHCSYKKIEENFLGRCHQTVEKYCITGLNCIDFKEDAIDAVKLWQKLVIFCIEDCS